ncbi:MAG: hypothetical protein RIC30_05840 [Marinoscillum sp.]|uniref:hypothetical protein n=1 Tax=Marinoscillum sp. TaxID=2024838 RepID=UPI0033045770
MSKVTEIIRYVKLILFPGLFIPKKKKEGEDHGIVFSFTTLPSRIQNIKPTVASLFDQKVRPDKVILNIPRFSKREQRVYKIPHFLKTCPYIQINEIEHDLGPATKLLPTLKLLKDTETLIVVGDDDEIYPRKLFDNYLNHQFGFKDSVMALVGWNAPRDFNHSHKEIRYGAIGSIPKTASKVEEPTQVDCVQGASTFAVKSVFFTENVFSYDKAPKEAFFVDDIWVSGHLAQNNIPIYVIPATFRYARMKVPSHLLFSETLHRKENKSGDNNSTIYRHFQEEWFSFKR